MGHLIAFLRSIWFFILLFFKARKVSTIFYYPNHFNRSIEGNPYFKPLIDVCKNNNIPYLIFEEPDYKLKYNRSTEAIPFDFVYVIIVLVRKLKSSSSNYINLDKKIGIFLSNNIEYGYNLAKLSWYVIDPLFQRNSAITPSHIANDPTQQTNNYVREVLITVIFPN